jgi:hypothetical protein
MRNDSPLPHWACVAFVARCSRLVMPIFDRVWPNMPQADRESLESAVRWAEATAASGRFNAEEEDQIDSKAVRVAGRLTLAARGLRPDESCPQDPFQADLASKVATVSAKATETARAGPGESYRIAMEAFSWALNVAKNDLELVEELHLDFASLRRTAAKENWGHGTKVVWNEGRWERAPSDQIKRWRWTR